MAEDGACSDVLWQSSPALTSSVFAANLTDPQKTVQIFVDLVARHESRFYHFVHEVHSKGEGLFDNLMKWIELFINFVRDGLPHPVSLDYLLPVGGQERKDIIAEVDAIVEYHRQLKAAHHARMRKRMLKGKETDADADAAFVTGVMDNLQLGQVMGDITDVTAEDSEEEQDDDEDDDATSEDSDEAPRLNGLQSRLDQAGSSSTGPQLEVLPKHPAGSRKKDRAPIEPPDLKLIPQLVPIFVELVREELVNARRRGSTSGTRPAN